VGGEKSLEACGEWKKTSQPSRKKTGIMKTEGYKGGEETVGVMTRKNVKTLD